MIQHPGMENLLHMLPLLYVVSYRYTGENSKIQSSEFFRVFGVVLGYLFTPFLHCILLKHLFL